MPGTKVATEGLAAFRTNTLLTADSSVLTSLQGIDVSAIQDGATCWVDDQGFSYRYDEASAVAQALPRIVAPGEGTGRWIRIEQVEEAVAQATWYVNATTGNDNDDGSTSLTALQTLAELAARFEGKRVTQNTTVLLTGDFSAEALTFRCSVDPAFLLLIQGTATTVDTGAVTAFTAEDGSTDTPGELTDGTQNFTPHVGRRIRMTSGAASGRVSWILVDVAPTQARVGEFASTSASTADPAPADTYVIETLDATVGQITMYVTGGGRWRIESLNGEGGTQQRWSFLGTNTLWGVRLQNTLTGNMPILGEGVARFIACLQAGDVDVVGPSAYAFYDHHGLGGALTGWDGAHLDFVTNARFQDGTVRVTTGAVCQQSSNLGIFDATGAAGVQVDALCSWVAPGVGILWGVNSAGLTVALKVQSGGAYTYGTKPTLAGTGDANVGGTAKTWAQIPFIEPANNAMVVAVA